MIFSAKVCPKAINFAIAKSIHQLLVLRPHPNAHAKDASQDARARARKLKGESPTCHNSTNTILISTVQIQKRTKKYKCNPDIKHTNPKKYKKVQIQS